MVMTSISLLACARVPEEHEHQPRRIVSLDYCADQYVLRFADREDIVALSPNAGKRFSYLRAESKGIPQVRPRTADVLALAPDLVVRSFGGGPNVTAMATSIGTPTGIGSSLPAATGW